MDSISKPPIMFISAGNSPVVGHPSFEMTGCLEALLFLYFSKGGLEYPRQENGNLLHLYYYSGIYTKFYKNIEKLESQEARMLECWEVGKAIFNCEL